MATELPNNKTAFLLKFVSPEYENDFIQGKLYMNNLKYFIDREKVSEVRGVGDALEASAIFTDVNFTFQHPQTKEVLISGKAGRVNLCSNLRVKSPVLCMYSVDKKVLRITSEDENYIYAVPYICPEDLEKLISDFGDNMLIIKAVEFAERVNIKCEELGIAYQMGKVRYYDFGVNHSDRVNNYIDLDGPDICFVKDDFFKTQNEYRILLDNIYSDGPYILDIGDISDLATNLKISDYFSGRYAIALKKS